MATTAMCTSAKAEFLSGTHNLASGGNTIKGLLIKASPTRTFDGTQTNVGTPGTGTPSASNVGTDEASGTGYTSGGATLASQTVTTSGTTAFADFADMSWTSASFSATALIIYNSTASGKTISVHDFGGTQTVSSGTFTVVFPTPDATNAILRIA